MKVYDVYDYRAAARLAEYAIDKAGFYTEYAYKIRESLKGRRYVVVTDEGFMAGSEPRPYFYVYSVSVDPVAWALERNPSLGVDMLTYDRFVDFEPIEVKAVYVFHAGRWVPYKPRYVYRIVVDRPERVTQVREAFLTREALENGIYASGFNIKYTVRVSWDNGFHPLGWRPLWLDPKSFEFRPPLGVEILVFDIEVVNNELYIVSMLRHRLGDEPRHDDVETVVCRAGRECDELLKSFRSARVVYGHNIVGFDIPHLLRNWAIPELILASKLDGVKILATHGNSFQIGASRSLYAVAKRLRRAAGVTDEELRLKEESDRILTSGDINLITKYNRNDVVLTAKIGNVILPFIYGVAGLLGAPPSVVQELPAGVLSEYLLFRILEYRRVIPGYKESNARMEGSKVLLPCAVGSASKTLLDFLNNLDS